MKRIGFAILLGVFAALSSTACASRRVAEEGLPEAPIAFVHWSDKAAQKRSEAFSKAGELPPLPEEKIDPEGRQELEIRAHLRAEESLQLARQLTKHPGRLMLYWPREDRLERLEAAPPGARPLAWSKDHRRLLFASAHRGGREQLYEYHLDRRDLRTLTVGPDEHPLGDYADDDRLVTLSLHRAAPYGASESTVRLHEPGDVVGREVAQGVPAGTLHVAPAGDRIVFEDVVPRLRRDGPTQYDSFIAVQPIAPASAEQGAPRAKSEQLLRGREPTLTPDGEWIVFASPSTAGYRLRRMRLDGSARVAVQPGTDEERMPTVSPDGEFIAFILAEDGKRRLAVRRFDGKAERVLLKEGWSEFPVW